MRKSKRQRGSKDIKDRAMEGMAEMLLILYSQMSNLPFPLLFAFAL
jgi:hypothetical protein